VCNKRIPRPVGGWLMEDLGIPVLAQYSMVAIKIFRRYPSCSGGAKKKKKKQTKEKKVRKKGPLLTS